MASSFISLEHVDAGHFAAFKRALFNILHLPLAEETYAQIVDGLPLKDVHLQFHTRNNIPAAIEAHVCLCPGVLDRVRSFRDRLDVTTLLFPSHTVQAYQTCRLGSTAFHLRLIELLVVACHQLAVFFYRLDDGVHSKAAQEAQLMADLAAVPAARTWERNRVPPRTYFYNGHYCLFEQYPDGVADVAGYWAETCIFGGVVVFDRGASDRECDGMYLHANRITTGSTLYPPTEAQFRALVAFLNASPSPQAQAQVEKIECPLPIIGSAANRWRWEPHDAFAVYHIYRDRYERVPSAFARRELLHTNRHVNFPEAQDKVVLLFQTVGPEYFGVPVDEEALRQANENLQRITPSSPAWQGPWPAKLERKAPWKPPYFFDPEPGQEERTGG